MFTGVRTYPKHCGYNQPNDGTRYAGEEVYSAIHNPKKVSGSKHCSPDGIKLEKNQSTLYRQRGYDSKLRYAQRMVTSTRPAVILVARADQVSCETQLSHRANGDEDKEEWVVMGLNVRHS